MEKCEILSVQYEESDSIEIQGKQNEIDKYIKKGYYDKEERNS
jgi:hypothetical protein